MGTLVVELTIDERTTASLSDYIISLDSEQLSQWRASPRIDINGSTITVTIPEGSYSAPLSIRPIDDSEIEGREVLSLRIVSNPSRYVTDVNDFRAITITDNDPDRVSIVAINPQLKESERDRSTLRIRRTASSQEMRINLFRDSSSTTNWSDYDLYATGGGSIWLNGSEVFIFLPQGVQETDLIITPQYDWMIEGAETLRFNLAQGDYIIDPANSSATVTIFDEGAEWKLAATADFDGDRKADLLWRNAITGENVWWKMDGTNLVSYSSFPSVVDLAWQIQGAADFDSDRKADLLWRNSMTGESVLWKMDGATLINYVSFPSLTDLSWQIQSLVDFDGDNQVDLLWRNSTTGESVLWKMNGTTLVNYSSVSSVSDPNWQIGSTADFDGDGKVDLLWRNLVTGEIALWKMDGTALVSHIPLPNVAYLDWKVVGTADFDGDGQVDLLWRNSMTGENVWWKMNGASLVSYFPFPSI